MVGDLRQRTPADLAAERWRLLGKGGCWGRCWRRNLVHQSRCRPHRTASHCSSPWRAPGNAAGFSCQRRRTKSVGRLLRFRSTGTWSLCRPTSEGQWQVSFRRDQTVRGIRGSGEKTKKGWWGRRSQNLIPASRGEGEELKAMTGREKRSISAADRDGVLPQEKGQLFCCGISLRQCVQQGPWLNLLEISWLNITEIPKIKFQNPGKTIFGLFVEHKHGNHLRNCFVIRTNGGNLINNHLTLTGIRRKKINLH